MYSSLRPRSGSAERSTAPSTTRSAYSTKDVISTSRDATGNSRATGPLVRSSRATSYDPDTVGVNRKPMSSTPYWTDRISSYSSAKPSFSGMSHSYHDYSMPSRTNNRYGSTEQLPYRSPYNSTSSSSFGTSSVYRSNPNFTRAGSVGRAAGGFSTSDYGLSRYRPAYTSTSTSSYQPKSSFDYRSKTPGYERSLPSRAGHYDRECRSMSRFEKASLSEDDDVEKTFQKLYNKYVKEDEPDKGSNEDKKTNEDGSKSSASVNPRSFISHSEAEEEASSEEEQSVEELDTSFAEQLRNIRRRADASITPRSSARNSPDATPKSSPMMPRKRDERATKSVVEVPAAESKLSTMDKLLRSDPLSAKLVDAIERKKSLTPAYGTDIKPNGPISVSETPSRSVSPNAAPAEKAEPLTKAPTPSSSENITTTAVTAALPNKTCPAFSKKPFASAAEAASPALVKPSVSGYMADAKKNSSLAAHSAPKEAMPTNIPQILKPIPNKDNSALRSHTPVATRKEASPAPPTTSTTEQALVSDKSSRDEEKRKQQEKIPHPIIVKPSVEDQNVQSSVNSAQEPTAEFTISISGAKKGTRSRSSSPVRRGQRNIEENTPQFLTVEAKEPRKLDSHHQHKMRRSASPSGKQSQSDNGNLDEGDDAKKGHRKRRDPNRTLEILKETLEQVKPKSAGDGRNDHESSSESDSTTEARDCPKPPRVLITQPSLPSTPMTTTVQIWNETTDGEWTEAEDEEDYESDLEYSVSQTFSLKDCMPIGDLYPLSRSSSRCSPFASDYDSDSSMPLFLLPSREAESRGRVNRLLANPPPSFTCSITYDGQESWDEESLHSCTDFDDEYSGRVSRYSRPGSSALGAYLSPTSFSSDEDYDGQHYHDEVDVGCTLRLVDKAAMRANDSDEDSEYYDDDEYDEEYWEKDEEYDEDEDYDEEEEYEEDEELEDEMHSFEESADDESRRSPHSLVVVQPAVEEEELSLEEMDAEFEVEATFEVAEPKVIEKPHEVLEKHREVTYTKDLSLMTEEEKAEQLRIEQEEGAKAIKKRVVKDAFSEHAGATLVSQRVVPAEEVVPVDESGILPDEEICELNVHQHEAETGVPEVYVIPTYVKPSTEKVVEESVSRFADKKVPTDFAKKAVIQPPKLQKAEVKEIETKIAPEELPEPPLPEKTAKESAKKAVNTKAKDSVAKVEPAKGFQQAKTSEEAKAAKKIEDKSVTRKSVLNMTAEDAKKKAAADEEAAKQKARSLGTVSSLLNKFKQPEVTEEPITYKRSAYLEQKEIERPKKKYNIIKPEINDDFDKQMEEIRAQMKSGSTQFQNHLKDLSKGITTVAEGIKKRTENEMHKIIMDSVTEVFTKADEEKARWKERRDAENERELARIEAEKPYRKKLVIDPAKQEPEKPAEPKRTIRKIIKDKHAPDVKVPSFAMVPKTLQAPAGAAATPAADATPARLTATPKIVQGGTTTATAAPVPSFAFTPKAQATPAKASAVPATLLTASVSPAVAKPTCTENLKVTKNDSMVTEDNYDLFEAATNVATRRGKNLAEMRACKEKAKTSPEPKEAAASTTKPGPRGDGAAATKIRNALGNATNIRKVESSSPKPSDVEPLKPSKRYSARRKTQEIVNESAEPKIKRRKQLFKRNRFTRDPHDIDILLGWEKENTFELMEQMFMKAGKERMNGSTHKKVKRAPASKIWISDLTDIDKIYKASEIRDIIASANDL